MAGCCSDDHCRETNPHDSPAWRRALWIALAVNAAMFLAEIAAGVAAGSASLQADALDFLGDSTNYAISLWVAGMALAWRARAALLKGASLGLLGVWVIGTAGWHAWAGTLPEAEVMGVVGLLALLANAGVALMLYRYRERRRQHALGLDLLAQRRDRQPRRPAGGRGRVRHRHRLARCHRRRDHGGLGHLRRLADRAAGRARAAPGARHRGPGLITGTPRSSLMSGRGFALVIALLAVAAGALVWAVSHFVRDATQTATGTTSGTALIVSEFELVDQDGRTVRGADLRGKLQLVFFGFTTCPDICPTTLTKITAALEDLGADAAALRPVLITVDPERDTPTVLKEYLTAFDPRILGLTGTPAQIAAALKGFRVYASKRELEGGDYTMDHSTFIYLMDRNGDYFGHFSASGSEDELVAGIRKAIADT